MPFDLPKNPRAFESIRALSPRAAIAAMGVSFVINAVLSIDCLGARDVQRSLRLRF